MYASDMILILSHTIIKIFRGIWDKPFFTSSTKKLRTNLINGKQIRQWGFPFPTTTFFFFFHSSAIVLTSTDISILCPAHIVTYIIYIYLHKALRIIFSVIALLQ